LSFQEACKALQLSEEELEQKVAAGEIASIKEGDSLYFKREVVENYKKQGTPEPTILISDEEINLLEEEEDLGDIDFGIEIEEPVEAEEKPEKAAAPAAREDGRVEISLEDDLDLLAEDAEITERSPELASEETVLNLDGILDDDDTEGTTPVSAAGGGLLDEGDSGGMGDETLLDTDILDLGEGEDTDTFELDTAEDTLLEPAEEGTLLRGGGARVMQMKRKKSHAPWTAVLVVTGLLFLLPLGVLLSLAYWETIPDKDVVSRTGDTYEWIEKYNVLRPAVESFADLFQ
jgi:excisionase family DNA binding protein